MSGIVAAWQKDGAPVDRARFLAMVASQQHRAIDGQDVWFSPDGSMALANLRFWTTPEEVGERQPVRTDSVALALDGRLDNRAELGAAIDLGLPEIRVQSDAQLLLQAYLRWGENFLDRITGPFAVVVCDVVQQRIVYGRDAVGRRPLCIHEDAGTWLAASEPQALLADPRVPDALDDVWIAHYFATTPPADGRTPFSAIREALPAHGVIVEADRGRSWRFWTPEPEPRLRYRDDREYVEHFRELLRQAVDRRLRAVGDVAVLMSGGLDSPSVAAEMAGIRATQPAARPVAVYSWRFDDLAGCDESTSFRSVVQHLGLQATEVAGDDCWGMRPPPAGLEDPNAPEADPYRALVDRVSEAAAADGHRVLLTGYGADELFGGYEHWLADLVADGRWGESVRELALHARQIGWRRALTSQSARRVAADPLRRLGLRRRRSSGPPAWLTSSAALAWEQGEAAMADGIVRPGQHELTTGAWAARPTLPMSFRAHVSAVELRTPYRDRDLIEFMLQVPAYMLYNGGEPKRLLRSAMLGVLPESVRTARKHYEMSPLLELGLCGPEGGRLRATLTAPDAAWRAFVRPAAVTEHGLPGTPASVTRLLQARCIAFDEWLDFTNSQATAHARPDAQRCDPTIPTGMHRRSV